MKPNMKLGKLILVLLIAVPVAFVLVALVGVAIEKIRQREELPFGCTVEQTTPSGECS